MIFFLLLFCGISSLPFLILAVYIVFSFCLHFNLSVQIIENNEKIFNNCPTLLDQNGRWPWRLDCLIGHELFLYCCLKALKEFFLFFSLSYFFCFFCFFFFFVVVVELSSIGHKTLSIGNSLFGQNCPSNDCVLLLLLMAKEIKTSRVNFCKLKRKKVSEGRDIRRKIKLCRELNSKVTLSGYI